MKPILTILILGIVLRLIISASTFHPDIRLLNIGGQIISSGNIINLYDFLSQLPKDHFLKKAYPADLLIYPPAIFFFHGFFNLFFGPLIDSAIVNNFLVDYPKALGNMALNLHLLFLKLPYLIFDLPAAYFLSQLFDSKRLKLFAFSFWIFNPVNLYATYLMGQFDIIPTSFVIFALYAVKKQITIFKLTPLQVAAIALGLGAVFKIYPFYLLIPLAALDSRWGGRVKILFLGLFPYFLSIFPYLFSSGFHSSALLAGHTLKSFYAQIGISGGESIILFLASLIFFYVLFLHENLDKQFIWQHFFIILLLFLTFTHYHPQWFLWLTPFLIIDLIKSEFKHIVLTLLSLISFAGLLFFFEPSLTVGLFSPIWPNLYLSESIWQQLGIGIDITLFRSIFQTIFAASAIYFIYHYFPKKNSYL